MKVNLEFLFVKVVNKEICYWKNEIDISDTNRDPDNIILYIIKNELEIGIKLINENYIIHSTSWRFENESIKLTYLIYSDHLDFVSNTIKKLTVNELVIATSDSHKMPRPVIINEKNVISHAIRHLAFLVNNDDRDKYKQILNKDTIELLKKLEFTPAGKI